MTKRLNSAERRAQIASVALGLLADHAVASLTTRTVAKAVGISQPALFRHFRSRDQILEAAVLEARSRLAVVAEEVLSERCVLTRLEMLPHQLLSFIAENPGLPRLLFYDASDDEEHSFHLPLRALHQMQTSFVATLVESAQQESKLPKSIDPARAGQLFVSLIQGTLLGWLHGGRSNLLCDSAKDLGQLFLTGLQAGIPARNEGQPSSLAVTDAEKSEFLFLDARPLLKAGQDPLDAIQAALEQLKPNGVLELLAPFLPRPLLQLMSNRGHECLVDEIEAQLFRVFIRVTPSEPLHDLREFEAPEPLERTLELVSALKPAHTLQVLVPRIPHVLFPHLKERAIEFAVQESFDGAALLTLKLSSTAKANQS